VRISWRIGFFVGDANALKPLQHSMKGVRITVFSRTFHLAVTQTPVQQSPLHRVSVERRRCAVREQLSTVFPGK
jgi:hypothetical protein